MVSPVHVKFGASGAEAFKSFLKDKLDASIQGLKDLHETKLPSWRRVYDAEPAEKKRHFPFENASNLVVPVVAIHCDTLQARIMAAVFKLRPLWTLHLAGDFSGEGDALRKVCEDYLTNLALEPDDLDLYRVYRDFTGDVIRYGTSVIKSPWETLIEASVVSAGDGSGSYTLVDDIVFDGSRPEKIPFEDFFVPPQTTTLRGAPFKAHRRRLSIHDLQLRQFKKLYDEKALAIVLNQPDRSGPTAPQKEQEAKAGTITIQGETAREWDIYECWCIWQHNGHVARLIATYHPKSDQLLRTIFSFFPDDPWVGARLFPRDGMYHGYGMIENLATFQEEISRQHNERRDGQTTRTNIFRIDPGSKLMEGFDIYPAARVPANQGEIEAINFAQPTSGETIEEERLGLDLADRRSGVSPPQQGFGAGQSKKGAYSAMGTLSMLSEGNTRTDMHISDIRDAHLRIGRVLSKQIAHLGLDESRFRSYGKDAERLQEAFAAIKAKRMYMPVLASTAAINREVEKQSDILLVGMMNRHYQTITQMIAQASAPMVPVEVREYVVRAIKAANSLMENVLRHFDAPEPTRLVPEAPNVNIQQGQPQAGGPMAGVPGGSGVPGMGNPPSGGVPQAGPRTQ